MAEVTIVMPAYNVAEYITASINSVLNQSFEDWELIIVNDGSTDDTQKIIEKFVALDSRIRLINKSNGGVSSARNKGLSFAQGKYVSFLDSDDCYDDSYIEMMSAPLRNNLSDMSFCKFQEKNGGRVLQESPRNMNELYKDSFVEHIMCIKNANHSMGTMYRLSIIRDHNVLFKEEYSYGEDLEFLLTMSCYCRVAFVPEYLYFYIFRGGSLSRRDIPYEDLLGELDSLYRLLALVNASPEIVCKKTYVKYIGMRELGTLNNIRRYYWMLLRDKKYDLLLQSLDHYRVNYGKEFGIKYKGLKKITNSFKLYILRSRSKFLWKIISLVPF